MTIYREIRLKSRPVGVPKDENFEIASVDLPAPGADTCAASPRAGLIGQPATALERVYILGPVRIIRPGDAVTGDVIPRRINFDLDATDRIMRIFCG